MCPAVIYCHIYIYIVSFSGDDNYARITYAMQQTPQRRKKVRNVRVLSFWMSGSPYPTELRVAVAQ